MSSASTGSNGRAGPGCGWWPRTKASAAGFRSRRSCPMTGRSTYFTARFGPTREIARRTSGEGPLAGEGGVRQGHRRLHRGDPARSRGRRGVHRPGRRLASEGRVRQGHRRLHRGDPARPQGRLGPTTTGATPGLEGRVRQGHRRLHRGDPARSQGRRRRTSTGATPGRSKEEYDKAIADFNEAIRLDPKTPRPTSAGAAPGA